MKVFIVFLLIFSSFCDGKDLGSIAIQTANTLISTSLFADPLMDPSPTFNVTVNITWAFTGGINVTSVLMTIKNLKSGQWAAIGLGQNQGMMEAHVFMCKRLLNDTIVLNRYVNPTGDYQRPQHAGSEQGGVLQPGEQLFIEGVVTCRFNLSQFTTQKVEQPNDLRPLSQSGSYHPLFAVGLLNNETEPNKHNNDSHIARPELVQLNQNEIILYKLPNPDDDNSMNYKRADGITN